MRGVVVRGYIMRYCKEEEWTADLEEATQDSLESCGDAIPHYVEADDGKFYEYYGRKIPEGKKVFTAKYDD